MAINNLGTGLRPGVCTSTTRPTTPYEGQMIYETDTDHMLVYNGVTFISVANVTYKVGDTGPGGGIIFFVDRFDEYSGFTYLEVAPVGAQVQRAWATDVNSNLSTAVSGADSLALGAGHQNTLDIVAQAGNVAATCAAAYCADLVSGGQSDWYLPSISEIKKIYDVVYFELSVSVFASASYWSSSEFGVGNAWRLAFNVGAQSVTAKSSPSNYVRPVRRF